MEYFARLEERFEGVVWEREFSFARHTTIGCGGTAALAASPKDTESAARLLSYLSAEGVPYCFLGAGANVLPSDDRFEGVVVRFHKMRSLYRTKSAVYAGAGVTGGALLRFAFEERVGGFEPFTGIPMTVGGGVVMNAGVPERHFSDLVLGVVGVEKGKIATFSGAECAFSEKKSLFQEGIAVTGVYLAALPSCKETIERETEKFRARREKLPNGRSMGCVFVNPEGDSAGRLIEQCGLKGKKSGGAFVSDRHANFILNRGGSAADVSALIDLVRKEVYQKTGVLLEEEIRRLP